MRHTRSLLDSLSSGARFGDASSSELREKERVRRGAGGPSGVLAIAQSRRVDLAANLRLRPQRQARDLCRRVLIGLVEKHAATGLCQAAIKPTGDPDRCADCPECAPPMPPWLTRDPPPPPPAPATPCGEKECSPSPPPALLADLADIMGFSG